MSDCWEGKRWVRIMADYSAEPVWNHKGIMGSVVDLPVSSSLASDLLAWQAKFDRYCPTNADDVWEVDDFAQEGLSLARRVKEEIPEWTVIYFDESKLTVPTSRPIYEYEIK